MTDHIVIANCGGFWGDDPTAAARQVEGGPIHYLVMDYLAEVTMAILNKQISQRPELGFASDFLVQLRQVLVDCVERDITIISNAGGVNPHGCRVAVEALAEELGVADRVRVGVVTGDDMRADLDSIMTEDPLTNLDTGEPLSTVRDRIVSANAYLGAEPIAAALRMGANVVITGRVTDAAVTLAPMIHEFGWESDDWDRLAAGVVAGHIIECGLQACGGNFTDWHLVPSHQTMGYPLVEAHADGSFVVTKHPDTGGMVSVHTVSEQLLYEIGDPAYLTPDCVAHFDSITLTQDGPDRVLVTGVRGSPPPSSLKVSISFHNGYRTFGRLVVSGPDTLAKASKLEAILWESVGGRDAFEESASQLIGWDGTHAPLTDAEPSEVMLQVAVRDPNRSKIDRQFIPKLVPLALSSIPGITGLADQGRPRSSDVIGYWPTLVDRSKITVTVEVGEHTTTIPLRHPRGELAVVRALDPSPTWEPTGNMVRVPLHRLCLARSGDKGGRANIGVIARSPEIYGWMSEHLTAEYVRERFGNVARGPVDRFELPNMLSLNFVLHDSLGGGGTMSLLLDAQGKTYAQYLLASDVEVDEALLP